MQSKAPEDVYFFLALAFTESSLDYYVNHRDGGKTIGPCGIVIRNWGKFLKDRNISPYSIQSCEAVYNELLVEYKTPYKTLKKYKGIESKNKEWILKKVFYIRNELLKKDKLKRKQNDGYNFQKQSYDSAR